MHTIDHQELKAKLDRGDDFKLVMTLGEWAFRAKHIPGSLNISTIDECLNVLDPEDEIVVYCSDVACSVSINIYKILTSKGYQNVRRYSGGLEEWEEVGYPLEGDLVDSQ